MADTNILYDQQGHPRHFSIVEDSNTAPNAMATNAARPASAQEAAKQFLASNAGLLQLKQNVMQSMDVRASLAPVAEDEALRFESEKHTMDSTVVSYNQTMFGLPIYQAGVSVVMHGPQNQVKAATSTLHYDVAAQPPGHSMANMGALDTAASGAHDNVVRRAIPAAQGMRINRTRMMVYQYDPADRVHHEHGDPGFGAQPPGLTLPPVPSSIKPGTHYIVVDALFSYALPNWGTLNWRAFVEPESGGVLFLRALVDGVTGLVFDRDPITKTGNLANLPTHRTRYSIPCAIPFSWSISGHRRPDTRTCPVRSCGSRMWIRQPRLYRPRSRRSISPLTLGPTISPRSMPTTIATGSSAPCATSASLFQTISTAPPFPSPSIITPLAMSSTRNAGATP